jgi:predicted transglutaminase-like cysteine proteinase
MIPLPAPAADHESTLQAVHSWAHVHFTYIPDEIRWLSNAPGTAANGDHWETDAELLADLEAHGRVHGDCDAFAKLCWLALRRLEIPSRLLACQTETGGWHLVCEAGGWVLDNRQPVIASRQDLERLGYRWHSMSAFLPGGQWTAVA